MKLTIFGATGRIGGHLLSWAVNAGHDVYALARSPEVLQPRDGLTVTGGDVPDPAAVATVISGADAVLSDLGRPSPTDSRHRPGSAPDPSIDAALGPAGQNRHP